MSKNSTKTSASVPGRAQGMNIPFYAYIIAIVMVFAVVYPYTFNSKIDINGDNANYFMLGKALSDGEGYVNLRSVNKTAHNHFPPGYPLIVAGLVTVAGDSFTAIKIFNGLLLLASSILLFLLGVRLTRLPALAAVASVLMLLNAYMLQFASMMMSEISFIFFSLLTFYLFLRLLDKKGNLLKSPLFYVLLLCLIMTYYIRAQGVALLGAMVVAFLIRKKFIPALVLVIGLVAAVAPWMVRSSNLGGNSYVKQLFSKNPYAPHLGAAGVEDFLARIGKNLGRYISTEIPESIFPSLMVNYKAPAEAGAWILGILLAAVIIYGLFTLVKNKWLTVAYVFFTMGILMLWPDVWVGVRFMLPLVPFLLLGGLWGLHSLTVRVAQSQKMNLSPSPLIYALFGVFMIGGISQLHENAKMPYAPAWKDYFEMARAVKDNDPGTLVICRKPTLFHIFSSSPTANFKKTTDDQELIEDFTRMNVDYVVLDNLGYSDTYNYLYPAVEKNPEHFQVAARLPGTNTLLLRFIP